MIKYRVAVLIYSGIGLKSTPWDQKKVLTLSKVDFIHFQETSPRIHNIKNR